jgi:hypothetical protein
MDLASVAARNAGYLTHRNKGAGACGFHGYRRTAPAAGRSGLGTRLRLGTVCNRAERVQLRGGGEDLRILPGAQGREDGVLCLVDRLGRKIDGQGGVGLGPLGIAFGHVSLNRGLLRVDSLAHSLGVLIPVALDPLPVRLYKDVLQMAAYGDFTTVGRLRQAFKRAAEERLKDASELEAQG